MTQISLSKTYALIDEERGVWLARKNSCINPYLLPVIKDALKSLNKLKKELALVSDAEQIPLGL